jgi:hypothetical protein
MLLRFRVEIDSLAFNGVDTPRDQQRRGVDAAMPARL